MIVAIVSSSTDCYIRVWDVETGEQMTTIDAGPMDAWLVRFSPDGHRIVTGQSIALLSSGQKVGWGLTTALINFA